MSTVYDVKAPRKATNLSVNQDLLQQARSLGINLSQTLEGRLIELIRAHREQEWRTENRHAVDDYNRRVEERGVFSDGLRRF